MLCTIYICFSLQDAKEQNRREREAAADAEWEARKNKLLTPSLSLILDGGLDDNSAYLDDRTRTADDNQVLNDSSLSLDPMAAALDSALESVNKSRVSEEEIVAATIEHGLAPLPPQSQGQLGFVEDLSVSTASFGYNDKKKKRKGNKKRISRLDEARPRRVYNRVSLFECLMDTIPPLKLPSKSLKPCALCVADITYEDKSLPCKHVRYGMIPKPPSPMSLLNLEPLNKTFNLSQCWSTDSTFLANTSMTFDEMERVIPDIDVRVSLADGTYEEKQQKMLEQEEKERKKLEEKERNAKEEALRLQEEQWRREKEKADAEAAAKEAQDQKIKRAEELAKAEKERCEALRKEKQDAVLKRKAEKEAGMKAKKEAKAAAAAAKEAEIIKRTRMRNGTLMDAETERVRQDMNLAVAEAAIEQLREAVKEKDVFAVQSAIVAAKDLHQEENQELNVEILAAEKMIQEHQKTQRNLEETRLRREKLAAARKQEEEAEIHAIIQKTKSDTVVKAAALKAEREMEAAIERAHLEDE